MAHQKLKRSDYRIRAGWCVANNSTCWRCVMRHGTTSTGDATQTAKTNEVAKTGCGGHK